jgi:hypothetical protein
MLEWGDDALAMPVVAPLPSNSSTPRVKQEQMKMELQSPNVPRIKRERQEDDLGTPRMKREPVQEGELRTPRVKREPMQKFLGSPAGPNSSVKVPFGPWEEHVRDHCVRADHCNKCMWANN